MVDQFVMQLQTTKRSVRIKGLQFPLSKKYRFNAAPKAIICLASAMSGGNRRDTLVSGKSCKGK